MIYFFIILLQAPLADIFQTRENPDKRSFLNEVNIEKEIDLIEIELFRVRRIAACDNGSIVLFDSARNNVWHYDGTDMRRLTSGAGRGPKDITGLTVLFCEGDLVGYYDGALMRLTILDMKHDEIVYQNVYSSPIETAVLASNTLFFTTGTTGDDWINGVDWLVKYNLDSRKKEPIKTIKTTDLGPQIALSGFITTHSDKVCHITIFSGLISCYNIHDSSMAFASSPINKDGFIVVEDRSHIIGAPPGTAIGKNPDDGIRNFNITMSSDIIYVLPFQRSRTHGYIDLYSAEDGIYLGTKLVKGHTIADIDYYDGTLYLVLNEIDGDKSIFAKAYLD